MVPLPFGWARFRIPLLGGVVQQRGSAHDLQVGALGARQPFCQPQHAQNVVEPVNRIVLWIPAAGLFDGWRVDHLELDWVNAAIFDHRLHQVVSKAITQMAVIVNR